MERTGRRGSRWGWATRRAAFLVCGSTFVLGVAAAILGSAFALGEWRWDHDSRVAIGVVTAKEIRPSQEHVKDVVDSRLQYRFTTDEGREHRAEGLYPVYLGWERVKVGDQIPIEYLPSGESRFAEMSGGTSDGWLFLAQLGAAAVAITIVPIALIVVADIRAGYFSWSRFVEYLMSEPNP